MVPKNSIKVTSVFQGVHIHEMDSGRFEVELEKEKFFFGSLIQATKFIAWAKKPKKLWYPAKAANQLNN